MKRVWMLLLATLVLSGCQNREIWNDQGAAERATKDREVWNTQGKIEGGERKIWNDRDDKPVIK